MSCLCLNSSHLKPVCADVMYLGINRRMWILDLVSIYCHNT